MPDCDLHNPSRRLGTRRVAVLVAHPRRAAGPGRMAPENGSHNGLEARASMQQRAETPAHAGASVARPEGLEPPTF